MTEIWRPVKGYEGLYDVSNQGRVRSLPRREQRGRWRPDKGCHEGGDKGYGRILKGWAYPQRRVIYHHLRDAYGNRENASLHRIVAEAHMPWIMGWAHLTVTFRDKDWRNCNLVNLKVVPKDRWHRQRATKDNRHAAKLTEDKVRQIRKLFRSNTSVTLKEVAKQYGVTMSCICKIKNGHTWKGIHP